MRVGFDVRSHSTFKDVYRSLEEVASLAVRTAGSLGSICALACIRSCPLTLRCQRLAHWREASPRGTRTSIEYTRCGLLLDLYHLHCNAVNFGFDAVEALSRLRLDRVVEIHVAGGTTHDGFLMDVHRDVVPKHSSTQAPCASSHSTHPKAQRPRPYPAPSLLPVSLTRQSFYKISASFQPTPDALPCQLIFARCPGLCRHGGESRCKQTAPALTGEQQGHTMAVSRHRRNFGRGDSPSRPE
jgi:hypothetical protein